MGSVSEGGEGDVLFEIVGGFDWVCDVLDGSAGGDRASDDVADGSDATGGESELEADVRETWVKLRTGG